MAKNKQNAASLLKSINWLLIKPLIMLIRLYQLFISPFLGSRCRFFPSCSSYAIDALKTHGAIKGCVMSVTRILKCHPLSKGGYDPVPSKQRD